MKNREARIALCTGLLMGWTWAGWAERTGLAPGTIRSAWRGGNVRPVTVARLEQAVSDAPGNLRMVAAGLWSEHNDWPAVEAAARGWEAQC